MTARSFCQWVNEELWPNESLELGFPRRVSIETSRKWLHELGFHVLDQKKINTFADMKEMMWLSIGRNSFVKWSLLDLLTKTMLQQSKLLSVFQVILNVILLLLLDKIVIIFHDESIFLAKHSGVVLTCIRLNQRVNVLVLWLQTLYMSTIDVYTIISIAV